MDKAEWQAFGDWVDGLRKRSGFQVRELAERAGVSAQWLQEIRHGGRAIYGEWRLPNPKDEALARLARALGVPVEEMFARAGRSPDASEEQAARDSDAAMERLRDLEQSVEQQQQELTELRRLIEQRPKRADAR